MHVKPDNKVVTFPLSMPPFCKSIQGFTVQKSANIDARRAEMTYFRTYLAELFALGTFH